MKKSININTITTPKNIPILEDMSENDFNIMMANGYLQALKGNSYNIDEVFDELIGF